MIKDKINIGATVNSYVSKSVDKRLSEISKDKAIPKSRLVAIAIDNEMCKNKPFEYDVTLPEVGDNVEYAYADEAGKLLNYMKDLTGGMGLDLLMSFRHDIGVPDKAIFLACFAECLHLETIVEFKSVKKSKKYHRNEDYSYYKLKPLKGEETSKKQWNKTKRHHQLLKAIETVKKLEKEFEHEA